MGNKPRSLAIEVVPAWHEFLSEVLPIGQATEAAAAANGILPADNRRRQFGTSSAAVYLRKLRSGAVGQPRPETVWSVSTAVQSLPSNEWCAAPLLLFAAGHFEEFAILLTGATEQLISRERKAALISAARTACDPPEIKINLKARLIAAGISETVAHKEATLRARGIGSTRADRNTWILESPERASFEDAFQKLLLRRAVEASTATITCRLVSLHAEIGLKVQRDIVLTTLLDAVKR